MVPLVQWRLRALVRRKRAQRRPFIERQANDPADTGETPTHEKGLRSLPYQWNQAQGA